METSRQRYTGGDFILILFTEPFLCQTLRFSCIRHLLFYLQCLSCFPWRCKGGLNDFLCAAVLILYMTGSKYIADFRGNAVGQQVREKRHLPFTVLCVNSSRFDEGQRSFLRFILGFIKDNDFPVADFQRQSVIPAESKQKRQIRLLGLFCPVNHGIIFCIVEKFHFRTGCYILCNRLQFCLLPTAGMFLPPQGVAVGNAHGLDLYLRRVSGYGYFINLKSPQRKYFFPDQTRPLRNLQGHIQRGSFFRKPA